MNLPPFLSYYTLVFLGRALLGPPGADLLGECRDIQERLGEMCRRMGHADASAGCAQLVQALGRQSPGGNVKLFVR